MLDVNVVSPSAPVYAGEASALSIEGAEGRMGVLPRHADIVAALGVGPLKISTAAGERRFAVWGGFLKVGGSRITVLVDRAIAAEDIDTAAVKAELDETIRALRHPATDKEFVALLDRRRWCQTQLSLVR